MILSLPRPHSLHKVMSDYLLDLLDLGAPYLPRAITSPLYSIISQLPSSPSELLQNPTSFLPLLVTLFSAYFAFNQFIGTLRWGFRTALTLLKLGVVGSTIAAVYMGYENIGTEKGVTGGVRDAFRTAENVGRGVFNVGKKGSQWYFGQEQGSWLGGRTGESAAQRRRRRSTAKSTNSKKRMFEDPEEVDLADELGGGGTQDFVKEAMKKAEGIWGMFNTDTSTRTRDTGRKAKKEAEDQGGFVWNLLKGQAKKYMNEAMEQPGAKATKGRNGRR